MGYPILVTAVFLVCDLMLNSGAHAQRQCRGASFSRHYDKRLECGIFKTLAANPFLCQKHCAETLNCFSVNTYNDDKGEEVCELSRKSKKSTENTKCLVDKPGSEHNELESAQTCSLKPNECSPKPEKKALPKDWYQLGSTAFKLFADKLSWYKAVDACKAAGANIAQIHSKEENQFVAETLMLDIRTPGLPSSVMPSPLAHWKLDGTDTNVRLHGNATFQKDIDSVTTVLNNPGIAGSYATVPSFDIRNTSFTISFWVKPNNKQHRIYYFYPWHHDKMVTVTLGTYGFGFRLYTQYGYQGCYYDIPIMYKRWTHYTAVWDRTNAKATLYVNGNKVYTKEYHENYTAVVPTILLPTFNLGRPYARRISISHVYLFDQSLTDDEVTRVRDSPYMGNSAWIGLHDINTEGQYQTETNETAKYINLAPGQIRQDVQDCVSIRAWGGGKMDVNHCSDNVLPYICMKRV